MRRLFVTASGTDVGKTYVMRVLIRELGARGLPLRVVKPVASGFDPAHAASSDPGILLAAQGLPITTEHLDRTSPWRFAAPLSPDMAAAREHRCIPFDDLLAFCRADAADALTLIEGIGGAMVPLDERHTVLDWIAALGAPVLLVAGSYLGALSHTLTAMRALSAEHVDVAALIVSESPDSTVGLDETLGALARFVAPVPVVALPRGDIGRAPALAPYLDLG